MDMLQFIFNLVLAVMFPMGMLFRLLLIMLDRHLQARHVNLVPLETTVSSLLLMLVLRLITPMWAFSIQIRYKGIVLLFLPPMTVVVSMPQFLDRVLLMGTLDKFPALIMVHPLRTITLVLLLQQWSPILAKSQEIIPLAKVGLVGLVGLVGW